MGDLEAPQSSELTSNPLSLLVALNAAVWIDLIMGLSSFLIFGIGMALAQSTIIWTGIGFYLGSIIFTWSLLLGWFHFIPKDSEISWNDLKQSPIKLLGVVMLIGPLVYLLTGLYLERYDIIGIGIGIYGGDGIFVLLMCFIEYIKQTPREEIGYNLIQVVMGFIFWLGLSIPFILIGVGTFWESPLLWKLGVGMYGLGFGLWIIITLMVHCRNRCGSPP